ncbi:CRISPR-associated helicase Cas3' [Proteiniphilum sp. X52]|nr:CRISPR-associated helicase Cas3' [Proteiniphilum sp. X52]
MNEKWQYACQKDFEDFFEWQIKHNGTFKDYAQHNIDKAGKNIRLAGVRHEWQSLLLNKTKNMSIVLQAAIAAHHGKLGFSFEQRWIEEKVECFWKDFQRESNRKNETLNLAQLAKVQYEFAGVRGLLQLADHRASAKEDEDVVPDHTRFNYQFPFPSKRGVQELVEKHWKEDLLLVRAPTGAGKTDASLLWASLQIANKRADRLIIAMPTRFTSNALSISVAENLSDTGLYHSSAWFNKFQNKIENGEIERQKAKKIHEFARLLETPVTICTIDHLLMALTLTREDHHLITFNLANSCLVIDEADFYDEFTQANILVLFEILKSWNVPVLLMSASLPESVLVEYQNIGYSVNEILEDVSDNTRKRFKIKDICEYEKPDDIADILILMAKRGSGIIYANTVDKAVSYYKWFQEYNNNSLEKIEVCLYHSRFTEPDKEKKEKEIIAMLGRSAWENNNAHGIVIMTQIGEMSINISADMMITEVCPIDRLTQRAGRMCRFDKTKIGELYVLIPQKDDGLYPAPYGSFDLHTKSWSSCEPLSKTIQLLKRKSYSAEELVDLLNVIYEQKVNYSSKSIENANNLKSYFMMNWLINPQQKSDEDADSVNFWRSRDIMPQDTVFVQKPDSRFFSNYLEFQNWKIYYSVELPIYIINSGMMQHKIDVINIRIKDEEKSIYVIRENFYGNEMGAMFTEENIFL